MLTYNKFLLSVLSKICFSNSNRNNNISRNSICYAKRNIILLQKCLTSIFCTKNGSVLGRNFVVGTNVVALMLMVSV